MHLVWLENDALKNNPKIEICDGDEGGKKYEFKPAIPVKDRKSLLQYLDKQESEGLGNWARSVEHYNFIDFRESVHRPSGQ